MQLELRLAEDSQSVRVEIEEWRVVPGFPRYEVSSFGRFRNRITGKYLRTHTSCDKYQHIGLVRNGKQEPKLVHRLVAMAFLEDPPSPHHTDVNHKNKIKTDNRVSNLEWMTRSQNSKHARSK